MRSRRRTVRQTSTWCRRRVAPRRRREVTLRSNLDSSLRVWAGRAATAVVLASGGVAMMLLSLGRRRPRHVSLLGLLVASAVAHEAETELVTSVLPRLLR